jgi:holo-[acyl-carrier protein] synthase
MISGIGVDLVTISRIARVYERFGERFECRVLHPIELEQIAAHSKPVHFLAKRFAVKEAALKALGTGERSGILFSDIYIQHDELGKPMLKIDGKARQYCQKHQINAMHVSISDEGNQVAAFVVCEKLS